MYNCTWTMNMHIWSFTWKCGYSCILYMNKYIEHTLNIIVLPYLKIIQQSKIMFMHSIYYNYAPITFQNTWIKNILKKLFTFKEISTLYFPRWIEQCRRFKIVPKPNYIQNCLHQHFPPLSPTPYPGPHNPLPNPPNQTPKISQ